ncbi:hypothetical protein ACQPZP_03090 [Spirillospora sp. CA-142024]|uniref:hypothetical protein n=1 Tax=Spirillospora sp. CA-142024 TaxID=3240036 RepID=UPI003D939D9D
MGAQNSSGMSRKAAAEKLEILLALAELAPRNREAAKLVQELAGQMLPELRNMVCGLIIVTASEPITAAFAEGLLSVDDLSKPSNDN